MIIFLEKISKIIVYAAFAVVLSTSNLHAQVQDFPNIDLSKADSIAALYPDHSIANLKALADKLTLPLSTEVEKFRAIFWWVSNNIQTDYGIFIRNKEKREKLKDKPEELKKWNDELRSSFYRKLVNEHKTVCTGYAYLVKELSYHAGLNCIMVDGYGRTSNANIVGSGVVNHTWNAVQVSNKWYLCDPTFSSGVIDGDQRKFIKRFDDLYFLTPPSLFMLNHYPLDSSRMLVRDKPTLEAFLNAPLVYHGAIKNQMVPLSPNTFQVEATKGKPIDFRFINKHDRPMKTLKLEIVQDNSPLSTIPEVHKDPDGTYLVHHTFDSKGKYIVHLLLDDQYIFTYKVNVSR